MAKSASSKKPKRKPKNAARSAHGQRIHNQPCEPSTPAPTLSSSNPNVRTRSAARREAAIMAVTLTRSACDHSASPQESVNNKKENEKKSVRFALDEDNVVADVTTTKDKPNPSDDPIQPTAPAPQVALTTQRPRPLSAPQILDQLLARNPDFGALHARLRVPSAAPRLLIRQLFADARNGKFSEAPTSTATTMSSPTDDEEERKGEEEEMQQEKKTMSKKEKAKVLRKMVARIVHDTCDGRDELANAGYFLQVLEEMERSRGGSDDGDNAGAAATAAAGGGDEGSEGVVSWLVEEVFKMLVILVSWHRQLAPREEEEDKGCILSTRQVLGLVEGEIEAAMRLVQGTT